MDFGWTEEQQQLRDRATAFAREYLGCDLIARDQRGARDPDDWLEAWRRCGEYGVFSLNVAQEYGGQGYDTLTTIGVLEALGLGCPDNGITLGLNGQIWAIQEPLQSFGTDEQKRRFLPGLASGELIGAHAMTEPDSGSDAFSLKSSATPVDGGYTLNGHKTCIGMAPACDLALVFATTDASLGQWGVSAFLVEADREGVERGEPQQKMGLRTAPMGELKLHNCWVPAANLLGAVGAGVSVFQTCMEWERSFIFSSHVGSMQRQLDQCVAYARERQQFGQPVAHFQSVSNRLADMKLRLETSRMLLYRAAWLKDRGKRTALDAALAKLHLSESFLASSIDAMRINGGRGYLSDYGIERDLRDAAGGVLYSGTSDIQRQVIARLLEA